MRRAFTLTEIMVVLLVMGIVAGAITLSLASPGRRADMDDCVGRVAQFDLLTRQHALRHGRRVQLVFNFETDRVSCKPHGAPGDMRPERACVLPAGYRLGRLMLAGKGVGKGRVAIWCSDRGYTPTYALRVDGPTGRRWILFSGLSGQAVQMENEEELTQTMALLSARADVD